MIAFSMLLVGSAVEAGIDVPDDILNYDVAKYQRWHIFQSAQLFKPQPYPGCHADNARLIASIPENELPELNMDKLVRKGFAIGYSVN